MKHFLLTLALLFSCFTNLSAQEKDNKKGNHSGWVIGIQGGINAANNSGNSYLKDAKWLGGSVYGATLGYRLWDVLSLGTELNFEQKGWKEELNAVDENGTSLGQTDLKYKNSYLTVPLFFKLSFGGVYKLDFNIGAYSGILLDTKKELQVEGEKIAVQEFEKFKTLDFGLSGGIGLNISLGNVLAFQIGGRLNKGLSELRKTVNDDTQLKNTSFMGTFGLQFKL